jgi:hypothetical protein
MTSFRFGVLVLTGCALLCGAVLLVPEAKSTSTAPAPRAIATPIDVPALRVLRRWDSRRANAYATGSPADLRDLYVAGSRSGEADLRLLSQYRARGWRVTGMRMQVVAIRVLEQRRRRLRIEVTDRLEGAVAVRPGRRVPLPRDRASTRRITLVRGTDGVWRVGAVGPVR